MRVYCLLFAAVLPAVAASTAPTLEQRLQWARENIDAHANMRHFEPPARSSGTKWHVVRMEGCHIELQQSAHREAPDSIFAHEGAFGSSEDKVVTWTFDLAALEPEYVTADTSTGLPHIRIFAEGDVFQLNTESVSRTLRQDGSVASTRMWSAPGNARNLWMYFDSPSADNKSVVKTLAEDLRGAIDQCAPKPPKGNLFTRGGNNRRDAPVPHPLRTDLSAGEQ
jgi:hypothetical protein